MVYIVISWNPWDCMFRYKKAFTYKALADKYVENYPLDNKKEEEIKIVEVEIGA